MGPDSNIEREVKLDVGLRFELPDLTGIVPGVVATRLPDAKLQATYVDTEDLRLMRWGVTLRHRRDAVGGAGAEAGWTVKLPMDADGVAVVRNELSWPGTFGAVPAEVASLVRAQARTGRLVPVARLLTERHRVELRDSAGRKLGEVDDDVVSVMDGRRLAARFRQVELEVTDAAPPDLLEEAMRALTAAGAVAGDDRPKVVRAIGPRASLGPDIVVPPLDGRSTVATVVSAAIAAGVTRMIRHDPGVRLGDDPEHVHQARVGTRRLRSDLRTFWRLLDPDWARPVRDELGWLGAAYGEVRDTDVLLGRFRSQIRTLSTVDSKAAAALLRRLAAQREEARVHLLEALNSDRYLALLENLAQAAANPPLARTDGGDENYQIPEADAGGELPRAAVAAIGGSATVAAASGAPATVAVLAANGSPGARAPANGTAGASAPALTGGHGVAPWPAPATGVPVAGTTMTGTTKGGPIGAGTATPGTATPSIATRGIATPGTATPGTATAGTATSGATAAGTTAPGATPHHRPLARQRQSSEMGDRLAAEVLPALVRRPWKHLQQAVEQLTEDSPDEALHEIRIRAKRLRYAAEAVSGVIGKPARQLASAVAGVQGVLGDMQDAVVAETWLRRQAGASPPSQALVAGQLVTLQRQEQATCREQWARPWKAASQKSLRRWFTS